MILPWESRSTGRKTWSSAALSFTDPKCTGPWDRAEVSVVMSATNRPLPYPALYKSLLNICRRPHCSCCCHDTVVTVGVAGGGEGTCVGVADCCSAG
jgi:hypothetical protein